jgi:hypothetical protein
MFQRVVVVDGNFSLQSMHMKKPDEDVALTDGEGFTVTDMPYRVHLAESVEYKQVCLPNKLQLTG